MYNDIEVDKEYLNVGAVLLDHYWQEEYGLSEEDVISETRKRLSCKNRVCRKKLHKQKSHTRRFNRRICHKGQKYRLNALPEECEL